MNDATTTHPALASTAAAMGTAAEPTEVLMSSRFLTNAALSVLGGFTVVASLVFAPATFMWLMLGAGVVAVATAASIGIARRGRAQRGLDGIVGALGAWTVVASLVFSGGPLTWLGFASGAALVGLGLVGLTLHELTTERVVHSIEVREATEREFASING